MPSAVLFDQPGPPAVLQWRPVASLTPRPHEVVISVQAAGVNNADLLQRRGHYPRPAVGAPSTGLECAGTVTAIGSNVTGWSPGRQAHPRQPRREWPSCTVRVERLPANSALPAKSARRWNGQPNRAEPNLGVPNGVEHPASIVGRTKIIGD
jgi:Alcohol dehydrogenase GroES-like domain